MQQLPSWMIKALPVVQFLLRLFSLGYNHFIRAEVVSCLRSQYCKLSALGFSKADIAEIDRLSIAAAVFRGEEQWQQALSGSGDLSNKVKTLFSILTNPKQFAKPEEHINWIEDVIEK